MDKTYNPHAIEQRWYETWEENGWFAPDGQGEPYAIMIPPPNVTGTLHMGHAFSDTIMDALIRYQRMKGRDTLWQPGTDHAGIATQMVVERQLNQEGKSRHDLGREAFIERVWDWKAHSGGSITRQLRRLGASPDWSRERFTLDEGMSDAVREVFIRLYEDGLIYRGRRLVNWDPVLQTALSDIEVINEEEQGHLWHLEYPLVDGSGTVTVATTRPETMLGDTAVAVHPDDERFSHWVGKLVELPLTGRQIPIIADAYVDPEFGSGCVKITPAHDFNDYAMGLRHDLPVINIFNAAAQLNDEVPEPFRGLDRFEARQRVIADLDAAGHLARTEKHSLKVPRGDRSGAVVEPWLTSQWYVDLTREVQEDGRPGGRAAITTPSIEAVRSGRIRFVPGNWDKTYYQWLENIEDWCISRQIWWGHRIPAWYDEQGQFYVGRSESEVREKHGLAASTRLRQDDDVLDTWFSSALWPFSTLGWPEQTDALDRFYPGSVLVTGFDIIFYWVARMIMFGTRFMAGEVPFHDVYIHGLVRDAHGQKMSKTKGNVLDPLDIIDGIELEPLLEKRTTNLMQPHMAPQIAEQTRQEYPDGIPAFGTDALRFTFASLASTGRDVRFDLKRVEGYRNFCNKLWNATRFVLMNTEGQSVREVPLNERNAIDRWIVGRLQQVEAEVGEAVANYRLDQVANALYEFTWNEYCDWHLELSKVSLNDASDPAQAEATRYTLLSVLETVLRLLHPLMPFITEELWQQIAPQIGRDGASIMLAPYPEADLNQIDESALADVEWLKQAVMGIRQVRSEMNVPPGKRIEVLAADTQEEDRQRLERFGDALKFLARLNELQTLGAGASEPESAVALAGQMRLLIPLAGLIDREAEMKRIGKQREQKQSEIERLTQKLANPGFTGKAPPEVVAQEQNKLREAELALEQLEAQYARVSAV